LALFFNALNIEMIDLKWGAKFGRKNGITKDISMSRISRILQKNLFGLPDPVQGYNCKVNS
jgi:hypothetical protein